MAGRSIRRLRRAGDGFAPAARRLAPASGLAWVRWTAVAAFLALALVQPATGRFGLPTWVPLALFAAYLAAAGRVRHRLSNHSLAAWLTVADLAAAGLAYVAGARPGGPLFGLLVVVVLCGAASLPAGDGLRYTVVAAGMVALIEPTLPLWSGAWGEAAELGTRVAVLLAVGVGTVMVKRETRRQAPASGEIENAATRQGELDRLRADFISTVSHSLRTPLTAARAGLGMLESSATDRLRPDERELLDNVRRNNERLMVLINDFLTLKQVEAGALQVEHSPLDLRAIVAAALPAVQPLIRQKGQTLTVALPDPLTVAGDARRLEQVVVNLVANAERHTPPGTHIAVHGRRAGRRVELTVSDDGPGIPPAEREAVFRPFHRLDASDDGSGLGLAIARGIVALHGGAIWVDSRPDGGAAFTVALPAAGIGPCRSNC